LFCASSSNALPGHGTNNAARHFHGKISKTDEESEQEILMVSLSNIGIFYDRILPDLERFSLGVLFSATS
jgi:hypothetical protein